MKSDVVRLVGQTEVAMRSWMQVWIAVLVVVLAGCDGKEAPGSGSTGSPAAHTRAGMVGGKVLQVLDAGRYTYVEMETPAGNRWVAAPSVPVKPGDHVTTEPGMLMQNFKSTQLGRTFAEVYFVGGISGPGTGHPACPLTAGAGQVTTQGVHHPPLVEGALPDRGAQAGEMPADAWRGEVLEKMDAGRYTYVRIKMAERTAWVAVPAVAVAVGEQVAVLPGMEMRDFFSKTLNRSFDVVFFCGALEVVGKADVKESTDKPGEGR